MAFNRRASMWQHGARCRPNIAATSAGSNQPLRGSVHRKRPLCSVLTGHMRQPIQLGRTPVVRDCAVASSLPSVACSSGNHAAAVALAARMRGIPAYIVVPSNAPACKISAVKEYGGEQTLGLANACCLVAQLQCNASGLSLVCHVGQ